jgi:hypothetical protein
VLGETAEVTPYRGAIACNDATRTQGPEKSNKAGLEAETPSMASSTTIEGENDEKTIKKIRGKLEKLPQDLSLSRQQQRLKPLQHHL